MIAGMLEKLQSMHVNQIKGFDKSFQELAKAALTSRSMHVNQIKGFDKSFQQLATAAATSRTSKKKSESKKELKGKTSKTCSGCIQCFSSCMLTYADVC